MKNLNDEIIHFLQHENFTVVSTIDEKGNIHNSCKGIIDIEKQGKIYLLDLYKQRTYDNLKNNHHISLTVVNEHKFKGYCLKGRAKIITSKRLKPHLLKAWEKKITSRITHRLLKNVRGEKGHHSHPEMLMPKPEYLIEMDVESVVDLTPHQLK
ncbi:MAG: pyridoxamine 5'-phosphate oxidase family protein [Candidatus Omnitrophica bacterium]|nr:pyridoxamine 5'-phosphate oxidase family protein [Candidatus Omnitrophota bacterium]